MLTKRLFPLSLGLFSPSPLMVTLKNLDWWNSTLLRRSTARPKESNPGPRFALVAGTLIVTNISYPTAPIPYSGVVVLLKSSYTSTFGSLNSTSGGSDIFSVLISDEILTKYSFPIAFMGWFSLK